MKNPTVQSFHSKRSEKCFTQVKLAPMASIVCKSVAAILAMIFRSRWTNKDHQPPINLICNNCKDIMFHSNDVFSANHEKYGCGFFSTKHLTVFEYWIANRIRCLKKAVAPGLMLNVVVSELLLS